MRHTPRIYTNDKLSASAVALPDNEYFHHLTNVLRVRNGDRALLFNEIDGEWESEILLEKRVIKFLCLKVTRPPVIEKGCSIIFSIISPPKMHFILEKGTELGVSEFFPIITHYTQNKSFNIEKAKKIVINSSEQCGRLDIPIVHQPANFQGFLARWNKEITICAGDKDEGEFIEMQSITNAFLIGPEGGLSDVDKKLLRNYNFVKFIKLGNNILRAETAAIAFASLSLLKNHM